MTEYQPAQPTSQLPYPSPTDGPFVPGPVEPTATVPAPTPSDPTATVPPPSGDPSTATADDLGSIIDTVLSLDELLSADVRRAEDVHRLYRRPDLQSQITELAERLDAITDETGRPLATGDDALGDSESAHSLALQIEELRKQYLAASGVVKLRQLDGDEWEAFQTKWKAELGKTGGPGTSMWNALIAATVVEPDLTVTNVIKMRQLYGATQIDVLAQHCWNINNESGVSVPKSPRSSLVLQRRRLATS